MINLLKKIQIIKQIIVLCERLLVLKKKKKIEAMIKRICKEEGIDAKLAIAVAKCESNLNPKAINKKGNYPSYSIDRGLFMWNDYYHPEISNKCAFNPECATRKFCRAVKGGHLSWWNPSRSCWKNYL